MLSGTQKEVYEQFVSLIEEMSTFLVNQQSGQTNNSSKPQPESQLSNPHDIPK